MMGIVLEQLKDLLVAADDTERKKVVKDVQDLLQSVETTDDTVNRVGYLPLQTSVARIGIDLNLFNILSESPGPKSLESLELQTRVQKAMLGRILRYMSSIGLVSEPSLDHFAANRVTKNLSLKGTQSAICHWYVMYSLVWQQPPHRKNTSFGTCGPMFQELPAFLKNTQYRSVENGSCTPFQSAFQTTLGPYPWFSQHPEHLEWFNNYMASRRSADETWLSTYNVESELRLKDWGSDDPIFVNIGGGIGHQCAEFKAKFPHINGRVILQDLPHTIHNALRTPGVENVAHDFFKPQPILGARYYFLRGVLHNWPDEKAREILLNIIPAMSEYSVLLLDEPVLPDSNVHQYVAAMDLNMMCALAGIQRTQSGWKTLLESVGLKIVRHVYYKPDMYEGVLEAVPARR